MHVRFGLDVLLTECPDLLTGKRIGLVTHAGAVTAQLVLAADALRRVGNLRALFAPEHGLYAHAADGAAVESFTDPRTGLPIHSLYGRTKKPTADMLRDVDLLILDIQDVGVRFYTYIWTMSYVLEACAEHAIPLLVLDRPNPIGGEIVEGPTVEPGYESFVGRWPIPLRHGLTVGELARMFNVERQLGVDLTVVPVKGWKRSLWYDQTGLPWAPPSPAMPKPDTAVVYPGTCLLEGTNVSCGRGTATPFEGIGAPWIDAYRLADALNELQLPGVRFRPIWFTPTASKWAGQTCQGIFVHVVERAAFRPLYTGLHLLSTLRHMWPDDFAWLPTSWEGHPPHFDLLIGNGWVRPQLDVGRPVDEIVAEWQDSSEKFKEYRKKYFLY